MDMPWSQLRSPSWLFDGLYALVLTIMAIMASVAVFLLCAAGFFYLVVRCCGDDKDSLPVLKHNKRKRL